MSKLAKRVLLGLYSRAFRERFGEDMWATYRAELGARRGRPLRWLLHLLRETTVMAVSGIADRARAARHVVARGMKMRLLPGVLSHEVRVALRRIRRYPTLALGVIGAFAIGVGANSAIYRVVDRLLLSAPPHVHEAERVRVLAVERYSSFRNERLTSPVHSYPEYMDWRAARTLTGIAGYDFSVRAMLTGRGEATRQLQVQSVTGTYFDVLGVRPVAGRFIHPDDDVVGAPPVVVISETLWRRDYAASGAALGATLELGDVAYQIIGVAPAGFTGVELQPVDTWVPLAPRRFVMNGPNWDRSRRHYWLRVVARVAPGVSVAQAEVELTLLHRAALGELPARGEQGYDPRVVAASLIPGESPLRPAEVDVARWLAAVALLLLTLASINVTSLLVTRQVGSVHEARTRVALGSSRARIALGVAVESCLLALAGCAAALLLGTWGGARLRALLLPNVSWEIPGTSWREPLLLVAVSLAAALAASVLPALHAARASGQVHRPGVGDGRELRATRTSLVIVQVAMSALLVVGASLFVRSFRLASTHDLGIDLAHTYYFQLITEADGDARQELLRNATARLAEHPAVVSAAAASTLPFFQMNGARLRAEGWDSIPGPALVQAVHGAYFDALGLDVRQGRGLAGHDTRGSERVGVVNQTMAARLWPEGALGRCLYIGENETSCTRVVGVIEDARAGGIGAEARMMYYVPVVQQAPADGLWVLYARVRRSASAEDASNIAEWLRSQDARVRFVEVHAVGSALDSQLRSWKMGASLFTSFGAAALALAAIGLYAMLGFDVTRRRRELAVRAALGATRHRLLRLLLSYGLATALTGVLLGCAAALALGSRLRGLLFETDPRDPESYIIAALVLCIAAAVSSIVPALRAARSDPAEALRSL